MTDRDPIPPELLGTTEPRDPLADEAITAARFLHGVLADLGFELPATLEPEGVTLTVQVTHRLPCGHDASCDVWEHELTIDRAGHEQQTYVGDGAALDTFERLVRGLDPCPICIGAS